MEELRDIKPLTEIPDMTFYLFLALVIVATFLTSLAVYVLFKILGYKKVNKKKMILEHLQSLDLNDGKKVAYEITKWGKEIVSDESQARLYQELVRKLTKYKYKKEVEPLSEELKKEIRLFLRLHNDE
ncbi:MAG: hypothetical protein GXO61_03260 [Epsilonproteobacteria bacterium]|nr:hypothetical protein [Campylobacterota bacterium]